MQTCETYIWPPNYQGVWYEEAGNMENIIQDYFSEMFKSSNLTDELMDEILESMIPRFTTEMNHKLTNPFTYNEVISA